MLLSNVQLKVSGNEIVNAVTKQIIKQSRHYYTLLSRHMDKKVPMVNHCSKSE